MLQVTKDLHPSILSHSQRFGSSTKGRAQEGNSGVSCQGGWHLRRLPFEIGNDVFQMAPWLYQRCPGGRGDYRAIESMVSDVKCVYINDINV